MGIGSFNGSEELKVAHVSFSKSGGAGVVASELAKSSRHLGFDSSAIFLVDRGIASEVFRHPLIFTAAVLDFRIRTLSRGSTDILCFDTTSQRSLKKNLDNKFSLGRNTDEQPGSFVMNKSTCLYSSSNAVLK